jgi:hypothetical protein
LVSPEKGGSISWTGHFRKSVPLVSCSGAAEEVLLQEFALPKSADLRRSHVFHGNGDGTVGQNSFFRAFPRSCLVAQAFRNSKLGNAVGTIDPGLVFTAFS